MSSATEPLIFAYVATGARYLAEAAQSAASARAHMPDCRIVLVTPDAEPPAAFDEVIRFGHGLKDPFELKIAGMARVEASRFVFLDTDTFFLGEVSDLFAVLDRFDVGVAQAPVRLQSNIWPDARHFVAAAPDCFPEFNTGVIAFRRGPEVVRLLEDWLALYKQHMAVQPPPRTQDQASFRTVLYESSLRVATLPPEYNCRFPYPVSVCGKVRILHGRGNAQMLSRIGNAINRSSGFRVINKDRFVRDSVLIRTAPANRNAENRR